MRTFDLQRFAGEAVQGRKLVYLFRVLSEAKTTEGATIAFTTENNRKKTKDADSTATKDGDIRTPGVSEQEITCTAILSKSDTMVGKLEDAFDSDSLIEIWEANLLEPAGADNRFKGRYFQGYLTELEINSDAEDYVEVSLTFGINGAGTAGNVTVTAKQQEVAGYVFRDTTKTNA